jgi:hypothetical protein
MVIIRCKSSPFQLSSQPLPSPLDTTRFIICPFHSKFYVYRNQTTLSVHIKKIETPVYNKIDKLMVKFDVGLLASDGEIVNRSKGTISDFWYSNKMGRLTNYRELVAKRFKLLDKNKMTIVVLLDLIETQNMLLGDAISTQFEKLFNSKRFSDFTLITSDGEEIPVHKNILSIRSPVFETMIETKMMESIEGKALIVDIDGKSLMEFLRFVYCGRVNYIDEVAMDLIHAATKYDVLDLKPLCVASLVRNISVENVLETMMLANLHDEKNLKEFCIDFIKW